MSNTCGLDLQFQSISINGAICLPLMSLMSISVLRLLSLAKSSLTENSGDFVAGTHSDTNPEHSRGIFSGLLAGEKPLPDKWAVGIYIFVCVCMHFCMCIKINQWTAFSVTKQSIYMYIAVVQSHPMHWMSLVGTYIYTISTVQG